MTTEIKMLKIKDVCDKTGLTKTTVYRKIQNDNFPPPKKDGKSSFWLEADIDKWIISKFNLNL